ncbi:MAG TPA: pilin glycosylation ligase domain-containing protein, partial [Ramlibacter sp.]|nr:pilin glycosylation ligase domain-containing protein [Ramlibacter sp.]
MSALRAGVCLDGSGAVVARLAIFGLVLVLPWLNPRAGGPSASIEPWLFSAFCLALAFGAQRPAGLRAAVVAGLAALIGWACLRTGIVPETMALAFACLLVLMAAAMAAGGRERGGFLHAIALGWLVAAGLSTAMALVQYVGASDRFSPWISLSTEAYANLRQRNQFATLTVIGMASLFWLAPRGLGRWPALAAICWLALGNAATTSRTGLLQMVLLGVLA